MKHVWMQRWQDVTFLRNLKATTTCSRHMMCHTWLCKCTQCVAEVPAAWHPCNTCPLHA
jgi:hypothetical protein